MIAGAALVTVLGCATGLESVPPAARAPGPPVLIGAVLDVESGKRLASSSIVVLGTGIGTQSDQNGRFRLTLPDASSWSIQARSLGYDDQVRTVNVLPGHFDTLVFRLKWRPPVNPPVRSIGPRR